MKKTLIFFLLTLQLLLLYLFFMDSNWRDTRALEVTMGRYKVGQQLTDQAVTAFMQDEAQRMWIGTKNGLNIYDGHEYKHLYYQAGDSTSIPDNNIITLARSAQGEIWVSTPNGVARHLGWFKFKHYALPTTTETYFQLADYGDRGMLVNNGTDVYRIHGDSISHFYRFSTYAEQSNLIYPDHEGGYWIIEPVLVRHFNSQGRETMAPIHNTANMSNSCLQGDTLWFNQSRQLSAIDLRQNKVVYSSTERLPIIPTSFYADGRGKLFLNSTFHGLYAFDTRSHELTKVTDDELHLNHQDVTISTFYGDAEQNLWIGFQHGGFQVVSPSSMTWGSLNSQPIHQATSGHAVTCMNAVGQYIIGSTADNLFCYNTATRTFSSSLYKDIFNDSPYYRQTLEDVVPYTDDKMWLVSNVRILSCQIVNNRIEMLSRVYSREHTGPLLGSGVAIGDELLLTSNSAYLLRTRFGSDVCDSIRIGNPNYNRESCLVTLPDGNVLVVMKGLDMALYHPQTGKVEPLHDDLNTQTLNADPSIAMRDSKGRVWIGTRHNGLYQFDIQQRQLHAVDYVPFARIHSIVEGEAGELWGCTPDDLFALQPQDSTLHFCAIPLSNNTLQANGQPLFINNSCKPAPGNALMVGTSEGCLSYPLHFSEADSKYNLSIQGLQIETTDNDRIGINTRITSGECFTFGHNENNITFEFANINYGNRERMMYQYILEGVDKHWSVPSLQPNATYSKLSPGIYKFKVCLIASPHHDALTQTEVTIRIKPHFWLSPAALYFYFILLVGIIFYIQWMLFKNQKNKLRMEQLEAERARDQRTNETNMNFFANISHEFRNPLTIISGPLLMLKDDDTLPYAARKSLGMVCVSVKRMLALIDQMLDFNKLEADALKLQVAQCDVATRLQSLVGLFAESAKLRGIAVSTLCPYENLYVWMDDDKFEKIMSNLLTNALKHTPDHGIIRVSLQQPSPDQLRIEVYNNGNPIDDDRLQDIFKRYYQVKGTESTHQYGWGTGIGLYYVKRLTELHHGTVSVHNEPEGGVSFVFSFPTCEEAYTPDEHATPTNNVAYIAPQTVQEVDDRAIEANQHAVNEAAKKPVILVVDDDIAVAQYTRSLFIDHYVVVNKYSAESALEEIEHIKPDIILSDVIMGNMNGYEFCRKLKSNLLTCHIPVILITAKSNINEQVEGFEGGANAYVTKPFDPRYLKAVVESLLHNIQMLRQKLADGEQNDLNTEALSEPDRHFLDQVYALMEKHISDQDLSVSVISQELLISHSKFNYKLKELTGETPGTFFRKYKLNVAAKLLKEGKHNVSEVAYMTGFGTASYFSVAFKKQFGKSPSEFV